MKAGSHFLPALKGQAWYANYWLATYATDVVLIICAVGLANWVRFGSSLSGIDAGNLEVGYDVVGAVITVVWVLMLAIARSREKRIVGTGMEEYRAVITGSLGAFGLVAVLSYLVGVDLSRGYFLIALPAGALFILCGRWVWRQSLNFARRRGYALTAAIIVGDCAEVTWAAQQFRRRPEAGYVPVALSVVGGLPPAAGTGTESLPYIPVDALADAVHQKKAGAVVVAGSMSREGIRALSWQLESANVDFVLLTRLTDVAGPRIHVSPVQGLPMVHVDLPQFSAVDRVFKRCLDVAVSVVALVVTSPILALIAIAIRLDDGGPVVFRQERVGMNGTVFVIHKFRTMAVDAEERMPELIREHGGKALLFKLKDDPRVTRIGGFLRRYSLDELPQFWDVLRGPMSVVGPRPQVAREVEQYEDHVHRRLLAKPGITGLWQVSGRNDLSVEESIRLDISYVENWSLSGDLVIILKTVGAVLRSSGAY